ADLVAELTAAFGYLECLRAGSHSLADLAQRHSDVIAALSADDSGAPAAFAGVDGTQLAGVLDELALSPLAADLRIGLHDYAELFSAVMRDRVVRRPGKPGVRVRILGP